jgi:branched-chain amino acid transport system ATP-binding protein
MDSRSGDGLSVSGIGVVIGNVRILEDVTFDVARGESLGIIGPNGAGKTTVLNVVSGVIRPQAGTVWFDGKKLTGRRPHYMRSHGIGRSLQTTQYFHDLTCRELVALAAVPNAVVKALAMRDHRAGHAGHALATLESLGLGEYAQLRVGQVSTAVQKLVDLARAVATGRSLLLLDEPTSGVSQTDRNVISRALAAVRETGRTVVLIDHDPSFVVKNCDRLLAMNFGRVLRHGPPSEVMRDEEVKRSYLG